MTDTPKTTKTRLCLISDTHTYPPNPPLSTSTAYRYPLPKADILLHAGDITKVGYRHEHEAMLAMLKEADAEIKIVIAGNHDITLDEEYYAHVGVLRHRWRVGYTEDIPKQGQGQSQSQSQSDGKGAPEDPKEIKALYTHPSTRAAGIHYLEEGLYTFTLPSTKARFTIYASPYTPEFCQWAFPYERHIDRYNDKNPTSSSSSSSSSAQRRDLDFTPPNPVPDWPAVDIMLTHGPPYGVYDKVVPSGSHVGCENLLKATTRAKPRLHVFGHIHEAYGAGRMDWGSKKIKEIKGDPEDVLEDRGVFVDASKGSENRGGNGELRFGEETLFVNASVVTVKYHAVNAPWVVDLDLPIAE